MSDTEVEEPDETPADPVVEEPETSGDPTGDEPEDPA